MRTLLLVALFLLLATIAWFSVDLRDQAMDHDTVQVKTVQQWGRESAPYVIASDMFTTTTTARPRSAPTRRTVHALSAEDNINGYPCGGDLYPPCWVFRRESGGSFTAYNPTGCGGRSCGGRAQWDPVTWMPGCTVAKYRAGSCTPYMGYRFAQDAPPDVQMQREREVWNHGAGASHWGLR